MHRNLQVNRPGFVGPIHILDQKHLINVPG